MQGGTWTGLMMEIPDQLEAPLQLSSAQRTLELLRPWALVSTLPANGGEGMVVIGYPTCGCFVPGRICPDA